MKPAQIVSWLSIGAALLTAGMWLGALDQRIKAIEQEQRFFHGDTPKELK